MCNNSVDKIPAENNCQQFKDKPQELIRFVRGCYITNTKNVKFEHGKNHFRNRSRNDHYGVWIDKSRWKEDGIYSNE